MGEEIFNNLTSHQMLFMFLGIPLVLPDNEESVLLGSAILGACASKDFADIPVR